MSQGTREPQEGWEQAQVWVWETGGREAREEARARVYRERIRPDQAYRDTEGA